MAIERGLIFTELIEQHPRRHVRTLIIEQVLDTVNNQRVTLTEGIRRGLINTQTTHYYHPIRQQQIPLADAYDQGYLIGRLVDQIPSSFITDHRQQTFYQINQIIDERTNQVYTLPEGKSRDVHSANAFSHLL